MYIYSRNASSAYSTKDCHSAVVCMNGQVRSGVHGHNILGMSICVDSCKHLAMLCACAIDIMK